MASSTHSLTYTTPLPPGPRPLLALGLFVSYSIQMLQFHVSSFFLQNLFQVYFESLPYGLNEETELIDYDELEALAVR